MDTVTIWVMALDYADTPYAINDESDMRGNFNDMLDEIYPPYEIAGITLYPSRILEECDPIAWRQGLLDYCDSEEWVELEIPSEIFHSADLDEVNEWIAAHA